MSPPLSTAHLKILNTEFYINKNLFGRDKLHKLLKNKYDDRAPSRRQIADWLKLQEINQIFYPSKGKAKDIKSTITSPHKILGIDIVNMQKHEVRGYKYLLNGIDLSTRYLYSVALKSKDKKEVLKGFEKMLKEVKDIRTIRSDNGSEFISKEFKDFLKKKNLNQVLSEAYKPQSNGAIERANGILKELIQKALELDEDYDWVKNLNKLVSNINNTEHSIKKATPKELEKAYKNNDKEAIDTAKENEIKAKKRTISKITFEKGDKVRLFQPSDKTRQRWSNEVYEIEKVYKPKKSYSVYEYKVKGLTDKFKEEELLKIAGIQNEIEKVDKYRISQLLRPLIKNNRAFYEVKWINYNKNTIEPRENLLLDVPKMLSQFEKKNKINFYPSRDKNNKVRLRVYIS
jgi:hypothetical protein